MINAFLIGFGCDLKFSVSKILDINSYLVLRCIYRYSAAAFGSLFNVVNIFSCGQVSVVDRRESYNTVQTAVYNLDHLSVFVVEGEFK